MMMLMGTISWCNNWPVIGQEEQQRKSIVLRIKRIDKMKLFSLENLLINSDFPAILLHLPPPLTIATHPIDQFVIIIRNFPKIPFLPFNFL